MKRTLESLIDLMRYQTIMYTSTLSITKFAMFIRGYSFAVYENNQNNDFYNVLGGFTDWMANKYSVKDAIAWDDILLYKTRDEKAALELFWIEWDEFQAEKPLN